MKRIGTYVGIALLLVAAAAFAHTATRPAENTVFAGLSEAVVLASSTPSTSIAPRREPPSGAREWYDETYRFSFFYPEDLTIKRYDEGAGAVTYSIQNIEKATGFQIFIVPYRASQVTEERFRQDVPSGVRRDMRAVTVDGAPGAAFYSTNQMLGETAEVWFVHGGYLYEVTTLKSLDSWLAEIMQSWRFL